MNRISGKTPSQDYKITTNGKQTSPKTSNERRTYTFVQNFFKTIFSIPSKVHSSIFNERISIIDSDKLGNKITKSIVLPYPRGTALKASTKRSKLNKILEKDFGFLALKNVSKKSHIETTISLLICLQQLKELQQNGKNKKAEELWDNIKKIYLDDDGPLYNPLTDFNSSIEIIKGEKIQDKDFNENLNTFIESCEEDINEFIINNNETENDINSHVEDNETKNDINNHSEDELEIHDTIEMQIAKNRKLLQKKYERNIKVIEDSTFVHFRGKNKTSENKKAKNPIEIIPPFLSPTSLPNKSFEIMRSHPSLINYKDTCFLTVLQTLQNLKSEGKNSAAETSWQSIQKNFFKKNSPFELQINEDNQLLEFSQQSLGDEDFDKNLKLQIDAYEKKINDFIDDHEQK